MSDNLRNDLAELGKTIAQAAKLDPDYIVEQCANVADQTADYEYGPGDQVRKLKGTFGPSQVRNAIIDECIKICKEVRSFWGQDIGSSAQECVDKLEKLK